MRHFGFACLLGTALVSSLTGALASTNPDAAAQKTAPDTAAHDVVTEGHIHLNRQNIDYRAIAGTLLVHTSQYDDSRSVIVKRENTSDNKGIRDDKTATEDPARASMFYTAYFRNNPRHEKRPVIFFYNGGPGASSAWLHLGSFGPYRLDTPGDHHLPPAPYKLVENPQTLLDIADLVFIDAPGAGFSRITGKDAEKEFYSLDGDSNAFTQFIMQFLEKYDLFNAPKYLFGESYGTLRSALIASKLTREENIDLNGAILLSQILSYDNSIDGADNNPGTDLPYVLALPSYAAASWYHHKLLAPNSSQTDLEAFLHEVEHFSITDYLLALQQGSDLPVEQREKIARQLSAYTGIPAHDWLRANLRMDGGTFEQQLLRDQGLTIGRLDSRYSGPSMDPTERDAAYDPQMAALGSAYVSMTNSYLRHMLHYGSGVKYEDLNLAATTRWRNTHTLPNGAPSENTPNVMPDLAAAMKLNPNLKIMLNSGYFDLGTPYYEGMYEMKHLPVPDALQGNISIHHYKVGHMVYVEPTALQQLHDHVAAFIQGSRPDSSSR